jgi:DNA-binding NarL/FixJ family response regulator
VRKRLKDLLENNGEWKICGEAGDGREGVALALRLLPDLVIIDLAMPIMDGFQASKEISAALPMMPILMHTQHDTKETRMEASRAGIRKVVIKGQSDEILLQAVEELLANRGAAT